MPDIAAQLLLETETVTIRNMCCQGRKAAPSEEESTTSTHLAFPYRGLFVRHLGRDQAVAEANQVVFFNRADGYRVSHPVPGGDASLDLRLSDPVLHELTPRALLRDDAIPAFRHQRLRIDPHAQALAALLRHRLQNGIAEPLEAESLALALAGRALGWRSVHAPGASRARQRLADRTKLLLASDPARRWTLAEIAAEVGHSPVYLTQVFKQVDGVPLYRYQLRLRLARALDLLPQYDDLTSLSLDLGFYSHSHFTTAFASAYGCSPSTFRQAASRRSTLPTGRTKYLGSLAPRPSGLLSTFERERIQRRT